VAVRSIDPADRRDLNAFVTLERRLYASEPRFVAQLDDETRRLLAGRSAFADGVELRLWTAERGGREIARAAGFVNRRWQDKHGDAAGFVGYLAAAEDARAATLELLDEACDWLRARGCDRAISGVAFSGQVSLGILTDGFDEDPMFPLTWNPPHLPAWLDETGWARSYPLYSYEVDFSSETYTRRRDAALRDPQCTIRTVDKGRWDAEIELFGELFNRGFADEWEFHPYTHAEFVELYGPLKRTLDERMLLFAEVDGEPAGLCLGFPDWTPAFRALDGTAGPFKRRRFRRAIAHPPRAGLICIALNPEVRGHGVGAALAAQLYTNLEQMGYGGGSYYLVNEVNRASRGLAESFGGMGRVLYHCFDKRLD
jgi:GNAT superfamily N-acetyltransferase